MTGAKPSSAVNFAKQSRELPVFIHRSTVLIILVLLLSAPILKDWVLYGGAAWYRIFIIWFFVIVLMAWNQRIINRRSESNAE